MSSHLMALNRFSMTRMFAKHAYKGRVAMPWLSSKVGNFMPRHLSMMEFENSLPRLPVPPLQQTMDKYLKAVEALVDKKEFETTKEIVKEFRKPGGVGELLHGKIVQRAEDTDNWLEEWWDNVFFYDQRVPLPIYYSPVGTFPKEDFKDKLSQLKYAARLITNMVKIKEEIDNETLSTDFAGKLPLTMYSCKSLFGGDRIPDVKRDEFFLAPKDQSKHVLVAYRNQFFVFDVYDAAGRPLSDNDLLLQLIRAVENSDPLEHPVGVLTATDRTFWAKERNELRRNKRNKESLDLISSAICVINLDKPPLQPSHSPAEMEDVATTVSGLNGLHGSGVDCNTMNRWFDKTLEYCISEDGYISGLFEHSPVDGPAVARVWEFAQEHSKGYESIDPSTSSSSLPNPVKLKWNLGHSSKEAIKTAKNQIQSSIDDLDLRCLVFDGYGKNLIKKQKLSPDAWIQISYQLTHYRLHGHIGPAYETASTRKFYRGRTENTRSSSIPTLQFVQAMDNQSMATADRLAFMQKAIRAHTEYTIEAMNGDGIDRHLFGLKMTAIESGIDLPDIFNDSTFKYFMYFTISTSQVPMKSETVVAFGPGVPEAYGICYNPLPDKIFFSLSTNKSNPVTNPEHFATALHRSLDSMRFLATSSKL